MGGWRWLFLGISCVSLSGCFLLTDDDDDCMSPMARANGLIDDCSGTYCQTNADCPSTHVCMRKPGDGSHEPNLPVGCVVPPEKGDGGSGS